MNDCEKYIEMMSQMLDDELTAEQTSELRTHIASCKVCRKVFDAFTGVSDALSEGLAEPPEMLAKGVMFKIRHQKKRRLFYGRFTTIAACVALVLLGAMKCGFFTAGPQDISLDSAATGGRVYGEALPQDSAAADEAAAPEKGSKFAPADLQKGIKLKTAEDGTVYQLGFPIQNVQLLEGAKPEEVRQEPSWLLNAKTLEVYKGAWSPYAESADRSEDKTEVKNERIATVTETETLDAIDELLTSDPGAMTEMTVENTEFSDKQPVYTIFIPAEKNTAETEPKASESAGTAENRTNAANGNETKASILRESLENMKNGLLNKDDAKESPAVSRNPGCDRKRAQDLIIRVYYVDGEIFCVTQLINDETSDSEKNEAEEGDEQGRTEKMEGTVKSSAAAQLTPSSSPAADGKTDLERFLPTTRILYRAVGEPEKLDALLENLAKSKETMLTQNTSRK